MKLTFGIILALVFMVSSFAVSNVYATSITLDASSCATLLGTWDGSSTCTISPPVYNGPPGVFYATAFDELVIPSGTTLNVASPNFNQYSNEGIVTNYGTIQITYGGGQAGFVNGGVLNNFGSILLANSGSSASINQKSTGVINNHGTITISNTGDFGIDNSGGVINNWSTINANSATSIRNRDSGTLVNYCGSTYNGNAPLGGSMTTPSCTTKKSSSDNGNSESDKERAKKSPSDNGKPTSSISSTPKADIPVRPQVKNFGGAESGPIPADGGNGWGKITVQPKVKSGSGAEQGPSPVCGNGFDYCPQPKKQLKPQPKPQPQPNTNCAAPYISILSTHWPHSIIYVDGVMYNGNMGTFTVSSGSHSVRVDGYGYDWTYAGSWGPKSGFVDYCKPWKITLN